MPVETDPLTGQTTTGHEWDGIKELDTPLPRTVVWFYAASLLFAAGCFVLLPAVPYVTDYTRGLLDHSSRAAVMSEVEEADERRREAHSDLLAAVPAALKAGTGLGDRAAAVLFDDNCAACHGRDLAGRPGFPDLRDSDWLWPNDLEGIITTIRYGVNADHDETRASEMPAYGRDGLLAQADITAVTEYVLEIAGHDHDAALSAAGAVVFAEQCASCHGDDGRGGLANGAPNLTDDKWLYGGGREAVLDILWTGKSGVMPAWNDRLDEIAIRSLALYVHNMQ